MELGHSIFLILFAHKVPADEEGLLVTLRKAIGLSHEIPTSKMLVVASTNRHDGFPLLPPQFEEGHQSLAYDRIPFLLQYL